MMDYGMIRVAAVSPKMKVGNCGYNVKEMARAYKEASDKGAKVVVFPELSVSGYTCGDLFYQRHLYIENLEGLKMLANITCGHSEVLIAGFYLKIGGSFYNCAALLQSGKIKGVVPKMFIPNYGEFYEDRWFADGIDICGIQEEVSLFGQKVPFGNIIFEDEKLGLSLGIEICEDLWMPVNPGAKLALAGADIICNLSASDEVVGKSQYRRDMVRVESGRSACGYVYTSAGPCESSTDLVFGGQTMIYENGTKLGEGESYNPETTMVIADIDYEKLQYDRTHGQTFAKGARAYGGSEEYLVVSLDSLKGPGQQAGEGAFLRPYTKLPFIPSDERALDSSCREIFHIQTSGLAKRLVHSRSRKCVVGISGGLDSTLALLVTAHTMKRLGRPASDVVAITMPGFGTTGKTYNNALTLMKLLGAEVREIPIGDAVMQHFKDIGQSADKHDVTYENSQARERTQILMDVANMEGGLVIGTGDLSEMALGWCTYNGDHMSMYAVNCGIPKTLVRFVVGWVKDNLLNEDEKFKDYSRDNKLLAKTLQDILDTPISPELLPPDENGEIAQKTEETVGPYELHDFFIYHTVRSGMRPAKLFAVACQVFGDQYDGAFIKKWLGTFYRRFFAQQFKRSCVPDGPKVGSVSLSPRGDWRMPSDADCESWLRELEE